MHTPPAGHRTFSTPRAGISQWLRAIRPTPHPAVPLVDPTLSGMRTTAGGLQPDPTAVADLPDTTSVQDRWVRATSSWATVVDVRHRRLRPWQLISGRLRHYDTKHDTNAAERSQAKPD